MNLNQVTLPATDIDASVAFYRQLGLIQVVSSPHYARFQCPEGEATFSVHLADSTVPECGVIVYFECRDLDEKVSRLQARGVRFDQPPTDQRWLWREARLKDPSGNVLCLYWAGENRLNPPWRLKTD
jgi:predicted enzyme related to lactoylglutathione lyase